MTDSGMVRVRLPDGTDVEVAAGTTAGVVLERWGRADPQRSLAALFDGAAIDLSRPIDRAGSLAPLTFEDPAGRQIEHHSAAHVVAKALVEAIPGALPTVGPADPEGFYYDFDVRPLTPDDLGRIEAHVDATVRAAEPFERIEVTKAKALEMVGSNPYKQGYLADAPESEPISFYRTGSFVDLCRGPHVPNAGFLEGITILGFSGVTSGGEPGGRPLQRVRGVAFPTRTELEGYLKARKEAEERDHRAIGQRLELFSLSEDSPGFPFWWPNGMIVVRELERYVLEHLAAAGYSEIRTPMIFPQSVYETSGHWEHYRKDMFLTQIDERPFGIKPMNCPGSMLLFGHRSRSYRELPLRLAEFAPLHRLEASGTIHGTTRAREFVQDDAHVFVTEEQIESEVRVLLDWVRDAFATFRLDFSYELSTRPQEFLGEAETWDRAEAALKRILDASRVAYRVSPGEGSFYGPKIDIHIRDSLGRAWQTGTIQLDYQMPRRFRLEYQGADGQLHTPVVIHRTILGSWERFLGVFLEHCNGRLPPWMAPVQVRVLPVAERHDGAAVDLVSELRRLSVRGESGGSADTLGKRVRQAEIDRIPYLAVIGDAEAQSGTIALRVRGTKGQQVLPRSEALERIRSRISQRAYDP